MTKRKRELSRETKTLARELEDDLVRSHGHVIGGRALLELLGYSSPDALNLALKRSRVEVPVFELPYRRGKWALARDVVLHLVSRRDTSAALNPNSRKSK